MTSPFLREQLPPKTYRSRSMIPANDNQDVIAVTDSIREAERWLPQLADRRLGGLVIKRYFSAIKSTEANVRAAHVNFMYAIAAATNKTARPVDLELRKLPPKTTQDPWPITRFGTPIPMHFDGFNQLSTTAAGSSELQSRLSLRFVKPENYTGVGQHYTRLGSFVFAMYRLTQTESDFLQFVTEQQPTHPDFFLRGQHWGQHRGVYIPIEADDLIAFHQFPIEGGPNYLHGTMDTTHDRESMVFTPYIIPPPPPPPAPFAPRL